MPAIPTHMRAVLLTGHGGFERLEPRDDVPVPVPGPGDVLIRVGASAVNNTDVNTRVGWYSAAVTTGTGDARDATGAGDGGWAGAIAFPRVQGADACGRIVAVGAHVDAARIGERVLVEPAFRTTGAADGVRYFGSECDGGFAEYATVPAPHAHRVESALADTDLASFPCSYSAAENMLARAGVAAGETVLVTGASGGVGSAAVQLARRRGATVLAVAGAAKADAVRALGAAIVFPRDAEISRVVGAGAVDVVVDVVGGGGFSTLLGVLRRGGRYVVAGAIDGPVVALDLRTLYLRDLTLRGCTALDPGVFANLVGYVERGEVVPVVAEVYPLASIVAAQEAFLSKRHVGKIVLVP